MANSQVESSDTGSVFRSPDEESVQVPDPQNPNETKEEEMVIIADEGGNEYLLPPDDTTPVTRVLDEDNAK